MRDHETSAPSLGDWVMVPREPTDRQLQAGATAWLSDPARRSSTLYLAMLAAAPPTAMAEAVAFARAEGVKEGLERAARIAEDRPDGWGAEYSFAASLVAGDIRALIPGGSSDV